jgi:protein tyrosine phosphatase (PTP) superfamily phosphohydrolase (DUF442 family)
MENTMRRTHSIRIFAGLCTLLIASISINGIAQVSPLAVNYVVASERLHTAGQPNKMQLSSIADLGFGLVINLATPTSQNAVPTEGQLIANAGASYLNIPVDWRDPTYADFELFSGVLNQSGHRQVLIHCALNFRASMFTFLYRVVHEQIIAEDAFKAVAEVWDPEEHWVEFGQMVLDRYEVDFTIP